MRITFRILLALACIALFSASASADTIVLKSGTKLEGTYQGGTTDMIKFEVGGSIQQFALVDVASLTFSARVATPAAKPAPAPAAAAAPAAPAAAVASIPAGTKIMIRTKDAVSTASAKKGSTFGATLDADLVVDGAVVAPKGSAVYGVVVESKGGRAVGTQRIAVTFDKLMIGNQAVTMVTDTVGAEGAPGGAAKKIGAGAIIGGAVDGGSGAAKGAAIGGAVAILAGGKNITVPANSLVEVSIKKQVTLPR
jgi:hypothetical protein